MEAEFVRAAVGEDDRRLFRAIAVDRRIRITMKNKRDQQQTHVKGIDTRMQVREREREVKLFPRSILTLFS